MINLHSILHHQRPRRLNTGITNLYFALALAFYEMPGGGAQEAVTRGIKKVGAERAAPVVLGPVTWVHLARHSNPQASEEETIALKKKYLDAMLPIFKVRVCVCVCEFIRLRIITAQSGHKICIDLAGVHS